MKVFLCLVVLFWSSILADDAELKLKDAKQSSDYAPSHSASAAIDGDISTSSHTKCIANEIEWFTVAFDTIGLVPISSVKVINGKINSYYTRLNNTKIWAVGNNNELAYCGEIITRDGWSVERQTYTVPCNNALGRGIRVRQTTKECLAIKELTVYSPSLESLPQPPEGCEDTDVGCAGWAHNGECKKSASAWMLSNCMGSCLPNCKVFDKCDDTNEECAYWAETDECENNVAYMSVYCATSCSRNTCEYTKIKLKSATQSSTYLSHVASNAIDGDLSTATHTAGGCTGTQWFTADFDTEALVPISGITIINGKIDHINYKRLNKTQIWAVGNNNELAYCGEIDIRSGEDITSQTYIVRCRNVLGRGIKVVHKDNCLEIKEISVYIPRPKPAGVVNVDAGRNSITPDYYQIDDVDGIGTDMFDGDLTTYSDLTAYSDLTVYSELFAMWWNKVKVTSIVLYMGSDTLSDQVSSLDLLLEADGVDVGDRHCDLLYNGLMAVGSNPRWVMEIGCSGTNINELRLVYKSNLPLRMYEIKVYGEELPLDESKVLFDGADVATEAFYATVTEPTKTPYKTDADQSDMLKNDVPQVFKSSKSDAVVWEPQFKKAIPFNKVKQQMSTKENKSTGSSFLAFLSYGGYLEYVVTEEKVDEKMAKKAAKKTDTKKTVKKTTKVDKADISNAIKIVQKFNGFPETGEVSREMLEYIAKPRCGINDVEFTTAQKKEEENNCFTLFELSRLKEEEGEEIPLTCGVLETSLFSMCAKMPARSPEKFIKDDLPYYIDVDLRFHAKTEKNWADLTTNFAIFYNFDSSIGKNGFGDVVKLFASKDSFGFQYQVLTSGVSKTVKVENYKLSKTQIARREFKIRIDVETGGTAYLLIDNEDVGELRYNYPMKSSALIRWVNKAPDMITARLCKRQSKPTRSKRFATSIHSWGTNAVTFNFQNYSSSLGEEGTRSGILKALTVISSKAKIEFIEKPKHEAVMLTYMFIKGKHADGMGFYGPGLEKAHAFSPVHSEVHFNDYEKFSLTKKSSYISMFFVALHETGHALGIKHSEYRDAVMNAAYSDSAFDVTSLHRDDLRALQSHYPGTGSGAVKLIASKQANVPWFKYRPRMPLPNECFKSIDAAVSIGLRMFLMSNAFIWEYRTFDLKQVRKTTRISDVFGGWNYPIRAAFSVGNRVYLVGDSVVYTYKLYGNKFILERSGMPKGMFNPKKGTEAIPRVQSAFSIQEKGSKYITYLIISSKEWFKITWKNTKTVLKLERKTSATGTGLLGKTFNSQEFTAAVAYQRVIKKTKVTQTEVYKFDGKIVKSVEVFPKTGKARNKDPWQEIPKAFGIDGMCVANKI